MSRAYCHRCYGYDDAERVLVDEDGLGVCVDCDPRGWCDQCGEALSRSERRAGEGVCERCVEAPTAKCVRCKTVFERGVAGNRPAPQEANGW